MTTTAIAEAHQELVERERTPLALCSSRLAAKGEGATK
jgi:hypothetical protein